MSSEGLLYDSVYMQYIDARSFRKYTALAFDLLVKL